MKNIFRKEVLIGVVAAISIAILVVGIDFLKGVNVFKPSNYYYATYTNVEGLAVSACDFERIQSRSGARNRV